ncbi:MAG TPA: head decoration protein [Polyangiaceae bacterium]|nr:head decoration protein [Polyangiaceae bacterium]
MANIVTTTIPANGEIILHREEFRDELLVFAGAGTVKRGTILARVGGNLVPFVAGGAGGAEVPVAVLATKDDVTATGAGNVSVRALVAGTVNKNRLIIHADGNGVNITNAILDKLRNVSIVAVDVAVLGPIG